MTGAAKAKGDHAEREFCAKTSDLLGVELRRKLGAGRLDDVGDVDGLPNWTIQCAWWPNRGILQAFRHKPLECERQQRNAGTTFGASAIRMNGGLWVMAQTPEQWATVVRELS